MHNFIYSLGVVFFLLLSLAASAFITWLFIYLWQEYKYRTWIYQAYDAFNMMYRWKYKNEEFLKKANWAMIEYLLKNLQGVGEEGNVFKNMLFKRWWINFLIKVMDTDQYQTWKIMQDY